MNRRVNAFANLADPPVFKPKVAPEKAIQEETIEKIAEDNDFPSRQAGKASREPRRKARVYRTGRNQHLGIKATAETVERFYKAADERKVPSGELLRLALDALDRAGISL
jgi:hypothetical protein